jgi:hypothetical protein
VETGNSDEAGKEHAKKPSMAIFDAQEEDRETDQEKKGREKSVQVAS